MIKTHTSTTSKLHKIFLAGSLGGILNITGLHLTFGIFSHLSVFNPAFQSDKMLNVWLKMEPLPSIEIVMAILVLFSFIRVGIYKLSSASWPKSTWSRSWRLALISFLLSYLFLALFVAFNLLNEPYFLILLELSWWALISLIEAIGICWVLKHEPGL